MFYDKACDDDRGHDAISKWQIAEEAYSIEQEVAEQERAAVEAAAAAAAAEAVAQTSPSEQPSAVPMDDSNEKESGNAS